MPVIDPSSYLQTVIAKDFGGAVHRHRGHPETTREPVVITLSRDYGAAGEAIAHSLSACLNIPVYDHEILDQVAARAKTDTFYFAAHDEQSAAGLSAFLYSLVSGTSATLQDYRHHLCEVVAELAQRDCILIGRGAHLILAEKPVFRVRVVGSKLICAQRIAEEFAIPLLDAERKVFEINKKRHKAIIDLYRDSIDECSLEHAKNFDLVINTDHLGSVSAAAVILLAMKESGIFHQVPLCKP